MTEYVFFWNSTTFSQFGNSKFAIDGITYNWAEQYMMSEKARVFNDPTTLVEILVAKTPAEVKALGRKVAGFNDSTWDLHKYNVVVKGNLAKFGQNPKLLKKLLETGTKMLVEASPYDKIWGIGLNEKQAKVTPESEWKGQNLLGKALMEVRTALST